MWWLVCVCVFFFFKQKTAYELRISDWSSDVCSSDLGVTGTLYFRLVVMRRDETAAGLAALAAMSWREFIHLVLDALARRGYARVFNRADPSGDNDYQLERDGKHYLPSCKHGRAFVLGGTQVVDLASEIRLAKPPSGPLATAG